MAHRRPKATATEIKNPAEEPRYRYRAPVPLFLKDAAPEAQELG